MAQQINYPAAQIVGPSVSTPSLSTSASVVVRVPGSSSGNKAAYWRIALSNGAAHFRLGTTAADTSTSAVTSDTVITANEALWVNTMGFGVVAFRQALASAGTAGCVGNVTPLEEGALRVPIDTSGLG